MQQNGLISLERGSALRSSPPAQNAKLLVARPEQTLISQVSLWGPGKRLGR